MENNRKAEANRKNAQKSTGPQSAAGKKKSSLNSTKHGLTAVNPVILHGESEGDFRTLRTGFHQAWTPVGDVEVFLVERLVQLAWRTRRAERVETELFTRQILADEALRLEAALAPKFKVPDVVASEFSSGLAPAVEADSGKQLAEKRLGMAGLRLGASFVGLSSGEDLLGKLQRYETAVERAFFRAAHELERLQRRRIGEHVAAPEVRDVEISLDRAAFADPNQVRAVGSPGMPEDRTAARSQPVRPLPPTQSPNRETNPTDLADASAAVLPAAEEGLPENVVVDMNTLADAAQSNCETNPPIDAQRAGMESTMFK